jgi:hypothetical protein
MGLFLRHLSSTTTSPLQDQLSSPQQQNKGGLRPRIRQRRRMTLPLERNLKRREESTKPELIGME